MKLSIATNFDPNLVHQAAQYNVHEFYGKLPSDIIGGGRSTYMLAPIRKSQFSKHVSLVRKHNMGFNYLLNASCLDNIETTKNGQKQIRQLLDWISDIDCTAVTVSNPLLLRMIKRTYPKLKVRISVFAGVDHLRKAKYWEDQGCDVICLDSLTINRDFQALASLRKNITCDLELLVNNNCLQSCPLSPTHMNLLSHSSQKNHKEGGFVIDHCILECSKMKLNEPVNYIRSDWIRPEDLKHYENLGYNRFKIVERNLPTEVMIKRIKSYSERKFEGNLLDLIQPYGHTSKTGKQKFNAHQFLWKLFFLLRPLKVNVFKIDLIRKLAQKKGMLGADQESMPNVYIDNRKLDGFLDRFLHQNCRNLDCNTCQYCHNIAKNSVQLNEQFRKECLHLHQQIDDNLETGGFWKW